MFINVVINKPFSGYIKGQTVKVATDKDGTPLEQDWRRRLKDAALDECCEIVKDKPKKRRA